MLLPSTLGPTTSPCPQARPAPRWLVDPLPLRKGTLAQPAPESLHAVPAARLAPRPRRASRRLRPVPHGERQLHRGLWRHRQLDEQLRVRDRRPVLGLGALERL